MFCVLEKITELSSDSHHKERFIGGKKDLEFFLVFFLVRLFKAKLHIAVISGVVLRG